MVLPSHDTAMFHNLRMYLYHRNGQRAYTYHWVMGENRHKTNVEPFLWESH